MRVAWAGLILMGGAVVSEIDAWADCVGSAILATVSMIVCNVSMVTGAVYTPFAMVPTGGASVQVTAVDGAPPIVTLN